MDASPLNNIPREIRDIIYSYALTSSKDIEMCPGAGAGYMRLGICTHMDSSLCIRGMVAGLPLVCKQIREESIPIFYSSNRFRASCWDGNRHVSRAGETMAHWIREAFRFKHSLPRDQWSLVKRLDFDMGVWKTQYMDTVNWMRTWRQIGSIGSGMQSEAKFTLELWVYLQNLGDLYVELSVPFGDAVKAKAELNSVLDRIREHIAKHPYEEEVIQQGLAHLDGNRCKLEEVFGQFPRSD
jgi:hypothetical protein